MSWLGICSEWNRVFTVKHARDKEQGYVSLHLIYCHVYDRQDYMKTAQSVASSSLLIVV